MLITKDFSRAHRDYIELGNLVEYLLPFLKVRYISINDGYDSNDYDGTTGGIDVVMRSIIYDAYSKDLSMKEKTGKRQSMKKGRRCSGFPPFGYVRDPKNKSMDLLDPEAAVIVRRNHIASCGIHHVVMIHSDAPCHNFRGRDFVILPIQL